MNRFSETETVVLERLHALKAAPEMSINLLDISTPMHAAGFSHDEIMAVIGAFEQEKLLACVPGNRLLILKEIPV